jgi:hypothetical protein
MDSLKSEMPRRNPDDETSGIQAGGLPGNQAGGDWEQYTPDVDVIEQHLVEINYPISKEELVQHLRYQKAPVEVVHFLQRLPDQQFHSKEEISRALERIA